MRGSICNLKFSVGPAVVNLELAESAHGNFGAPQCSPHGSGMQMPNIVKTVFDGNRRERLMPNNSEVFPIFLVFSVFQSPQVPAEHLKGFAIVEPLRIFQKVNSFWIVYNFF